MQAYQIQLGLARSAGVLTHGQQVYLEPGAEELFAVWKQVSFDPKPTVLVDPKAKPAGDFKDLQPRDNITLIFTGKPCKEWATWLKKHNISLLDKGELSKAGMTGLLVKGSPMLGNFKMTQDAAEIVVEVFGDATANGFFSICFTIEHARKPEQTLLGVDDLADIWPDPGFRLARDIAHDLGTMKALEIFQRVPRYASESIFGLWRYLDIVCGSKHPQWLHLLHKFRSACDRKRYGYWEGLFLFIHACVQEKRGRSVDYTVRCGVPF